MKDEFVYNDEVLNIVNEIEESDRTIKGLKKVCPNEMKKLDETLLNYMVGNDLKVLKTAFPVEWKFLT